MTGVDRFCRRDIELRRGSPKQGRSEAVQRCSPNSPKGTRDAPWLDLPVRHGREGAPVAELLANAGRVADAAHAVGVPVIHSVPAGEAFAEQVVPHMGDTVLTARKYSAFARTRLDGRLRELRRDQVVVVGCSPGSAC